MEILNFRLSRMSLSILGGWWLVVGEHLCILIQIWPIFGICMGPNMGVLWAFLGYFWNLYGPKYRRFKAFWGSMQYGSKIGNST